MIYCLDVDGTLLDTTWDAEGVPWSEPLVDRIKYVNQLALEGHEIRIYTARGSETGIDWREYTRAQLIEAGLIWDGEVYIKPYADVYVDDHAMSDWQFFWEADGNHGGL